jgi:hypothetical protein
MFKKGSPVKRRKRTMLLHLHNLMLTLLPQYLWMQQWLCPQLNPHRQRQWLHPHV